MSFHYVDKLLYEAQGKQWECWELFRKLSEELTKLNGGVTIDIGLDVDIQDATVEQLLKGE